jgi:hypothetical protein
VEARFLLGIDGDRVLFRSVALTGDAGMTVGGATLTGSTTLTTCLSGLGPWQANLIVRFGAAVVVLPSFLLPVVEADDLINSCGF